MRLIGRSIRTAVATLATLGMASCSTLPASGPDGAAIRASASGGLTHPDGAVKFDYALVDLTMTVLDYLKDSGPGSFYASFGAGRGPAPEIRVGVGDVVQVSVFESAAGGLFVPADAGSRPGNYVTFPQQTIDRVGTISVPYAGQIPAAGRTLPQIQDDIVGRLANRAIEPQAVVSILNQTSSQAAVVGDVQTANKFSVNPSGDRILDMIARAGGLRYPDYESFVTLQRRGRTATVFYKTLVNTPAENVYVAPGDTISVYREQRAFLAFGATGLSGRFTFDAAALTLAEGVGKAGGLLDDRADPAQVYLYRLENRRALEKAGVDLSKFPPEKTLIPTIYHSNFRDPASFFVAQRLPMRDKDMIYISNASSVELIKFLNLVNNVSSTASGVSSDVVVTRDAARAIGHGH